MVRRVINEYDDNAAVTLLSPDRCSFDENIEALLPRAVAFVQKNKELPGRVNVKSCTPDVVNESDGCGRIALPGDFFSPVSIMLAGWEAPCTRILEQGSREAALQQSRYTRAGLCRPVCVAGVMSDGSRCVRLYPLSNAGGQQVSLVYEATFVPADGLNQCDATMVDAVVYECAALLYNMFERHDTANIYHSLALALCRNKQ
jgi:hypothetical protein